MARTLKHSFVLTGRSVLVLASSVGAGIISDFLKPLVALGWWAVALTGIIGCSAGAYWLLHERPVLRGQVAGGHLAAHDYDEAAAGNHWLQATLGSMVAFPVLVMMTAMSGRHAERGFLAESIPSIQDVQERLLSIERTSEAVAADTRALRSQVAEMDKKLDIGFEALEKALTVRGSNPILTPRTPQDYLLNAKIYSATGDYPKAKESYRQFFAYGFPFIDPHLDYQSLVKNTDGLLVAKQEYRRMTGDGLPLARFLNIVLDEADDSRYLSLTQLHRDAPDFGPALIELIPLEPARQAEMFNRTIQLPSGASSEILCATVKRYRSLLAALDTAAANGSYLRYYLDKRQSEDRARAARQIVVQNLSNWAGYDICAQADSIRRRLGGYDILPRDGKTVDSLVKLITEPAGRR